MSKKNYLKISLILFLSWFHLATWETWVTLNPFVHLIQVDHLRGVPPSSGHVCIWIFVQQNGKIRKIMNMNTPAFSSVVQVVCVLSGLVLVSVSRIYNRRYEPILCKISWLLKIFKELYDQGLFKQHSDFFSSHQIWWNWYVWGLVIRSP